MRGQSRGQRRMRLRLIRPILPAESESCVGPCKRSAAGHNLCAAFSQVALRLPDLPWICNILRHPCFVGRSKRSAARQKGGTSASVSADRDSVLNPRLHGIAAPVWSIIALQCTEISERLPALTGGEIHTLARPVNGITSSSDISVKGRIWPVPHLTDPAMLDRIDIAVVFVPNKIIVVANSMFPKARLPDISAMQGAGKPFFDIPPAPGVIAIAFW